MIKTIRSLYHKTKPLSSLDLPLPTELFTFPLGLTFALLFSPLTAWIGVAGTLALCVAGLFVLGGLSANRSIMHRSLFVLGLWGILLLLASDTLIGHPLGVQSLLLISYLVSSIVVALYRFVDARREHPKQCLCIRGRILRVERLRFERILVVFSFIALIFIGLCTMLCPVHWRILLYAASAFVVVFTWSVYALECAHLVWVKKRLEREVWIPVLNDQQQPVGRVPMTTPEPSEGRLPVVRLIATSRDMIYLEQAHEARLPQTAGYDTPFVAWLTEGYRPDQVAQELIDLRFCGIRRARPRFLLHYHETIAGQDLSVYLFAVDIADPSQLLVDCLPIKGRWWPIEHLTSELETGAFARYLLAEYPYLEQTILLAHRLRSSSPTHP